MILSRFQGLVIFRKYKDLEDLVDGIKFSATFSSRKFALLLFVSCLIVLDADLKAQDDVTFYGRAHLGVDFLDGGESSGLNVSSNTSRVGIRAKNDIFENLRAIIQIEQEVRFDNGGGNFATRDSFVGLDGAFGIIRLGLIDTPLKAIRSRVDLFGDQIGDARNLTRLNQEPFNQDFDARFRNGIYYTTPVFGGLVLDLHHSTNTTTGTNPPDEKASAYSGTISYNSRTLYLAAAYETWEARNQSNAFRFGIRYSFGDLVLTGLAQQAEVKSLIDEDTNAPLAVEDVRTLGVGVSYKILPNLTAKGQVYQLTAKDRNKSDASLLALGADYFLNNQVRLLFAYALTKNDEFASYRATGGGYGDQITPSPGETTSGISAGIRYDI